MDTEIRKLITLLSHTYEQDAWHGPSVKEALKDVTADIASRRLPNTHSIIELVAHMTSWRTYVVRKLQGDAAYDVSEELNFPKVTDWEDTIKRLDESQLQLIAGLEKATAETLDQVVPGREHPLTFFTLLHGIIHHDLYHTGQIMLIKKATAQQTF